ncbi:3,4-dihydroxy 2-butanone 4-phosphate synthase/GTP cyclohydrolase II [Scopulibacillus daqui]|uniref:Riboflavin biosynthesis protein RibBA n=1 Tax=Scopulibacillus daqui TaxID=1469162 RepID=A0ABS2Q0Z6_9BACL|nr:bifunctional 3,4-dihydroxy-2-butanone-4-phosphate synthase/GTP cyclohydrolase II [Scopulibacillus daqui]MBM7645349.1 3,4-dihydroxy 2-butanone 4-phosphate synthase/GTP cyclohydrolase II [Scopulibacillus daqui]
MDKNAEQTKRFDSIEEAIEDLKAGRVIIVCDDEDRENEGDFIALAEKATPEVINFMITEGRGLLCAPIDESIASRLQLHPMVEHNTDANGTAFTVSIDHKDTTTGISAFERSKTIQAMLDPFAAPEDFKRPGHIFPLIAKPGGVLTRAGHTEAAVDLARLSGSFPAGVICEIMKKDGRMARVPDLQKIADHFGLKMVTIPDLMKFRNDNDPLIKREVAVDLPTDYGDFKVIAYSNNIDHKEHLAIIKGDIASNEPALVRVHSECLTGDVFGSHRCDCGPQLHAALSEIERQGQGVLIYMRQEGRGIGLINKLKAYKLQEQGYDTVEANEKLGFAADLRDYEISAHILNDLGVSRIRLLTNNPRKINGLAACGIEIAERVPLEMPANKNNIKYLKTKHEKLGHLIHC